MADTLSEDGKGLGASQPGQVNRRKPRQGRELPRSNGASLCNGTPEPIAVSPKASASLKIGFEVPAFGRATGVGDTRLCSCVMQSVNQRLGILSKKMFSFLFAVKEDKRSQKWKDTNCTDWARIEHPEHEKMGEY